MSRYLIMTLGTGEGIESGLAFSIRNHNPDEIIFLASEASENTLGRLRPLISDHIERVSEPVIVSDINDVEKCALDALECIMGLLRQGSEKRDILADFTFGTKAMTAGLCIASVGMGLPRLGYVTGDRDPRTGRVIPGTEREITANLGRLTAHENRRKLIDFFNKRRFADGLALAEEVGKVLGVQEIREEFRCWKSLLEAFHRWDLFDHAEAMRLMGEPDRAFLNRYQLDLDSCKEMLGRINRMIGRAALFPELLADLLANADRRAAEGRYDDAAARLYRACEMAGQMALKEKGQDPSNIDLDSLPPEGRTLIEKPSGADDKVVIAQDRVFKLLRVLGDERAALYLENNRLRSCLSIRNHSILAHGVQPVSCEDYETMRKEVMPICQAFVQGLDRFTALAAFPVIEVDI